MLEVFDVHVQNAVLVVHARPGGGMGWSWTMDRHINREKDLLLTIIFARDDNNFPTDFH